MKLTAAQKGFSFVELLIVISIIAVIVSVIFSLLNPSELIKQGRDAARLTELANLHKTINYLLQENPENIPQTLCYGIASPCEGSSNDTSYNTRAADGVGWLKINLKATANSVLPVDPLNNSVYFFTYKTNQGATKWEVNAKFESKKYKPLMQSDTGNNPDIYELGTDLKILP